VYNITNANNVFMDQKIPPGFYTPKDLVKIIKIILDKTPGFEDILVSFSTNTLRYTFESLTSSILYTGSLMGFLNMEKSRILVGPGRSFIISSGSAIEFYASAQNIFVQCDEMEVRNIKVENSVRNDTSNRIVKIPIKTRFGEYIIHEDTNLKVQIFTDTIHAFSLSFINDLNESLFLDNRWSMTFRFLIYNDSSASENLTVYKPGSDNNNFPVVTRYVAHLKDANEIYYDKVLKFKTHYLSQEPYYFSDQEILKIILLDNKLKKAIEKKSILIIIKWVEIS
jgi:hypothetical protein